MSAPDTDQLRITEAERLRVQDWLSTATGEGSLTLDEFGDRTRLLLEARTRGELAAITRDLPVPAPAERPSVRRGTQRKWLVALLGGFSTKGRWRPAPRTTAVAVMGGGEIDLRGAQVEGDELTLTAVAVMGGLEITVPRGWEVDLSGIAFMGGREVDIDEAAIRPDLPLLHVRGYALMGGIEVKHAKDDLGPSPSTPGGATAVTALRQARLPAKREARLPSQRSWWGKLALIGAGVVLVGGSASGLGGLDAVGIMGGAERDYTNLEPGARVELDALALMGGVNIFVNPDTTRVESNAIGIMGGVNCNVCSQQPNIDNPAVVVVDGLALMGGINIEDATAGEAESLRERIDDLEEEIDDATEEGNAASAEALTAALQTLQDELEALD